MRNILIVLVIIIFGSCEYERNKQSDKKDENIDSTQLYYNISLDNKMSLRQKQEAINKSLYYAKINDNDTLLAKVLYQKNLVHYSLAEYDSLLLFSDSLINYSKRNNLKSRLAKQFYLKGFYFDEVAHNPDSAFINYNLSKNHFQYLKDSSWVGKNLLQMGIIQKNQGDFFGSKETITEALKYLNKEKDTNYIVSSFNGLATNHRKLLNHEDAIKYYKKALAFSINKADRIVINNNLSATYIDNKNYNEALNLLTELVKDSLLSEKPNEYARVLDNIAYAEWLSGKNESKLKLLVALNIRIKNNDLRGQIASYTHLGEVYSNSNSKKANIYLDSVFILAKKLKNPRAEKDALKQLMELEPYNLKLKNRYVFLQDSLYAQELKVKTQFAKYKYDDKLIQEANLRLEKENAEQKLEVTNQQNKRKLTYAFGGFLFLIFAFSTYILVQRSKRLKQKNKTAKLEATYETESELSRKLHDDFGGKLNYAMLLVQNDSDKLKLLDTLDGLYNQSRDFSREINDVDTGPNFKESLIGMMGNYCKNTKLIVSGSSDLNWSKLSSLSKKTLFKILQELMINMQKHSGASLVSVAFEQSKKTLKVSFMDNGVGASKTDLNFKNGLMNTEKRIEAIGGTIIFESDKGRGFEAQIEIPN
ncbi:tetratricopeptide repeat-containing sensor histidine kinase [Cellulophaga tyrosinoxydans]|uniref:Histidine kinase/HSP90-like ATPase domain-containing protein n=1 Tax=Cellulophaga tyrosinoxydans TaxID=504486 RepID=A0A1W1YGL6_9FLAO|nr:ATP-binding protein [Cellulophaga tyrosinoxydans]SMC35274.1 hypothetical protein SAMN05660703_0452 [Cellulophaga tyrosinoxydans]